MCTETPTSSLEFSFGTELLLGAFSNLRKEIKNPDLSWTEPFRFSSVWAAAKGRRQLTGFLWSKWSQQRATDFPQKPLEWGMSLHRLCRLRSRQNCWCLCRCWALGPQGQPLPRKRWERAKDRKRGESQEKKKGCVNKTIRLHKRFPVGANGWHSLSLMVSKVHRSFLKNGCCLISSTPFLPNRTSLETHKTSAQKSHVNQSATAGLVTRAKVTAAWK